MGLIFFFAFYIVGKELLNYFSCTYHVNYVCRDDREQGVGRASVPLTGLDLMGRNAVVLGGVYGW